MEIERYAELRAEMDTGALRDDVLARAGLSVDEWVGVQRDWLEKMGDELSRGRRELTNQYTKAFLERQRALAGAKERGPSPRVETTPPQAPSPQAALPQAALPQAALPQAALPQAPMPPLPPLPRAPMPPAPLPPPKVPLPPARVAPPLETAPLQPVVLSAPSSEPPPVASSPVLPFKPAPAPAPVAAQSALPAPKPPLPTQPLSNDLSGTVAATMMSPFATALPFAKAPPPPPPSRPDSVSSTSMPIPPSRPDSVSSTSMPVPPLPVAKPPPKPAPPPLPPKAPPPPPLAAAPPPAPAAAPLPSLTVEQHASLCAELAFTPARADDILGRYRVTPEGKARFDQVMRERFAENPTLQSRWQEAYQVYYAFLRGATAKQRPKDG